MTGSNKKRLCVRVIALALALIIFSILLCSCANRVESPVLEYDKQALSLSTYEFMLSRMKGTLARNKYDVEPLSEFWNEKHPGSGLTNEEYYNQAILDNCKNYLAALILFDEDKLTLSSSDLAAIEEEIEFYIDYDCKGDESKLDAILSKYGTDTDGLRKIYEIEAKYQKVIASLYGANGSQIADSVKEEYYQANYYRFKQILVSNFYYEYQKDGKGDTIYFDRENGKPIYDTKGEYHYDDKGNRVTDKFGVAIRYDENGNILYDTEKGYPAPTTDDKGNAIQHKYSEEEMRARVEKMQDILDAAEGGNASAFEAKMPEWQLYEGAEEYYKDGYYLSDVDSSGYDDNMHNILAALKEMKVGETRVIESDAGYHVVMKYELDKGKYADSDYAEWFASFTQSLITKLFLDRCKAFYSSIEINEKNLKKAKSIKSLGTNYDY